MTKKKEALPISATCQNCTKRVATTRRREIYAKNYTGPCGDSFCYASCDSSSCHPISAVICDTCEKLLARAK